jgi:DNA-binding response OmpR family regulator
MDSERRAAETPGARVLVVEDEPNIRDLIALHLQLEGLTPIAVADGNEALRRARADPFDLVVLDLMLPGLDGVTVCRAIRRETPNADVPILMLTARREESDKVLGLESGADDYLTKPFGIREFIARVRALLRRPRPSRLTGAPTDSAKPVTARGLTVDPARRHARMNAREIELTSHEFDLLYLLASHPGIVFSREALLRRVWGDDTFVTDRSVDTLVKRLRRKIEDDVTEPQLILTVWGTGYKFAPAEPAEHV